MDTITTALGGAVLGRALPPEKAGPVATLVVTTASVLPDADVIFDAFSREPLAGLTSHRAFTHSLLGVVVLAPLLALVFWRFTRDKNYLRLLSLCALGLLWHLWTDLNTSWGTMIYYPDRTRVVWDLVFIIDFIFTAILLFPHLEIFIYRRAAGALRRGALTWLALAAFTAAGVGLGSRIFGMAYRWDLLVLLVALEAALLAAPALRNWGFRQRPAVFARIGVGALAVYMAVCIGAHHVALARVERFAAAEKLEVKALAALPQPLSPFRWSGLVLTRAGVYQAFFNVLDWSPARFEFFASDSNEYVREADADPQVKIYLWFARFPLVRSHDAPGEHVVEYTDLRFRAPYNRRNPFVYRVVLDDEGRVMASGMESPLEHRPEVQ
jgi:membrane-bound metal-dependent hydrolase YbcI (DUF457 family)